MKKTEELKMLKGWKEFFNNLTVEWMIENNLGVADSEYSENSNWPKVTVWCYLFEITWDDKVYSFDSPDHLGSDDLLSRKVDRILSKCLPRNVMNDFVRVVEL